jgi:scyllo-inositol 2-dehydrogenase (NADP+)
MPINVGVIGYGLAGRIFHTPFVTSAPGLTLTTVVSSDPTKVHRDYPDVNVVATVPELLADPTIGLVVVATPNTTHADFARQAMLAGKHVVVDKPFTIDTREADELIALARQQGVLLSVYQSRRFDNDFQTIRQLVASDVLGAINTYEVHYDRYKPAVGEKWRDQELPGSGVLYDLGAHLIDQALVLFGLPETVWANVRAQRTGAQVDDYFHIVLGYPATAAILHAGSIVRASGPHFQLHGAKGSFIKYGLDSQEEALFAGLRPGSPGWGADPVAMYGELTVDAGTLPVTGKVTTLVADYTAFYQQMAEAIAEGKPVPVDPQDSRNAIRVIELARQSQQEQRVVPFQANAEG